MTTKPIVKIELRFDDTVIYEKDSFLMWLYTCKSRIYCVETFQDNKTREYIVILMGRSENIKYCLELLGLQALLEEKTNENR